MKKNAIQLLLWSGVGKCRGIATSFPSNPKPIQTWPALSSSFFIQYKKNSSTSITNTITNKRAEAEDQFLLQVLQSEIAYEKSRQIDWEEAGNRKFLGPFVLDWDAPDSQDVVLRRSYEQEEIAITALLDSDCCGENDAGEIYLRAVLMKVCITKPGITSILHFDCRLQGYGNDAVINLVSYHQSTQSLHPSKYRGPPFRTLDYALQDAFKEFLEVRGINVELGNFLIRHLHNKEQQQYVKWLHSLASIIKKGLESG